MLWNVTIHGHCGTTTVEAGSRLQALNRFAQRHGYEDIAALMAAWPHAVVQARPVQPNQEN